MGFSTEKLELAPETGRVDTESLFGERNWKVVKKVKGMLPLNEKIVVPGISKANYHSFVEFIVPALTKFVSSFDKKSFKRIAKLHMHQAAKNLGCNRSKYSLDSLMTECDQLPLELASKHGITKA